MAVRDIGIAAHAADQRSDPFSLNLGIVVQWDRYVFQRQLLIDASLPNVLPMNPLASATMSTLRLETVWPVPWNSP